MECYKYNNVEDYIHHLKKLISEGLNFFEAIEEEETYLDYFYEYDDFVLFVCRDDEYGQLSYGHTFWVDDSYELKLYTRKNSNINSY